MFHANSLALPNDRCWPRTLGAWGSYCAMVSLIYVAGCSSLPRPKLLTTSAKPRAASTAENKPELVNPAGQQAAIAWETAKLAEQRGMDREAIEAFLEVRKHEPGKAGVAHSLAVLYDRSGMTDAADREYAKALTETPRNADVCCDYGYFLYSVGRPEEAESHLRKALQIAPKHHQATVNLGLLLGSQAKYDEAQQLFTAAIGPAAAMHNIGMLKLRAGDRVAGHELLREAKRRDPSIAPGDAALAWLAQHP